jgi:hypothetical protein
LNVDNYYEISASCLVSGTTNIKVMIGVNDITLPADTNNRLVVYAKMWTKHASYDAVAHTNNIGLVYLPSDVYYSTKSTIANIYLKDPTINSVYDAIYDGFDLEIVGWGENIGDPSNTLQTIQSSFLDRGSCDTSYPSRTSKEICVQGGACNGDQGSPAVVGGFLVGIVNYVPSDCSNPVERLLTAIYPHFEWVVTKLRAADAGNIWT